MPFLATFSSLQRPENKDKFHGTDVAKHVVMSPIQIVCLGFITGIIFAAINQSVLLPPVFLAFCVALCIKCSKRGFVQIAVLAVLTGFVVGDFRSQKATLVTPKNNCHRIFEGIVSNPPDIHHKHIRFTVQLSRLSACILSKKTPKLAPYRQTVFVTLLDSSEGFPYKGDTIRFSAMCQLHRPYSKTWGQPLSTHNYITAVIPNNEHILLQHSTRTPVKVWLQHQRLSIARYFDTHLSATNAAIAKALTIGQRNSLNSEQKEMFRKTGTAHLLAVSGLHLGILALLSYGVVFFFLKRFYTIATRVDVSRICAAICIPVIGLFTLLTGANPPVVRAFVMLGFILTAKIMCQRVSAIQTISLAACTLLSFNPLLIKNPGFQLSFSTVLTFLFFLKKALVSPQASEIPVKNSPPDSDPRMHGVLRWLHPTGKYIIKTAHASVLAAAATSPLLAYHFEQVPLLAPVVNVIVIPIVSLFVLPLLLITAQTALFSHHLASLLAPPCDIALSLLQTIILWVKPISLTLSIQSNTGLLCVCLASSTLLLLFRKKIKSALCTAFLFGITLTFAVHYISPVFPPKALIFDFLDVGQGDATLVTFPNGAHWLIDGGGTAHREMGHGHLLPIFESLNISSLDKVILTHPDPDHLLGLPQILKNLSVGEIWDNGQGIEEETHPAYRRMLQIAAEKSIPLKSGDALCRLHQVGDVTITVLHPCFSQQSYAPGLSFNNNSIVTRFTYHRHSTLLVGDLSFEGEQVLLKKKVPLSSGLLKLGHHGSSGASSNPFLKRVSPKHAIASCGFKNRYDFPTIAVQKRLAQKKIQLLRTDTQGWIRYIIHKGDTKIQFQKKTF